MTPRRFDSMAVFLRQCHFQDLQSQLTYRKFSIVWLPRVKCLLLLCKAEPAWIKRSIHYVILQHSITIRGSYSKKFLPNSNVTFDTKGANFENDIDSENGSKIKTPSSISLILVSFCWKKNVLLITALTNLITSLISFKLVIECVAFFLGHPVYEWCIQCIQLSSFHSICRWHQCVHV